MVKLNNPNKDPYLTYWLYSSLLVVILLITVGGLTRLTTSGLSITNWELFKGILPPLNAEQWQNYFSLYKKIPQYQKLNAGMLLNEFKYIFWWEYIHRILARLSFFVFAIPFIVFLFKNKLTASEKLFCSLIAILFLSQGAAGWYMVKSGLNSNVLVSHFRLSIHLLLGEFIISLIFFTALLVKREKIKLNKYSYLILIFLIIVFIQIGVGAFVSGLNAGLIYQTWPLMNGDYIPKDIYIIKYFKDLKVYSIPEYVQFLHRNIAYLIFLFFLTIFYLTKNFSKIRSFVKYVFGVLLLQIILGICTLLSGINIYLAIFHQIGSVLLILSIVLLFYKISTLSIKD